MNSQLYDKKYPVPEEILRNIEFSLHKYSGNSEGIKRAKFLKNNRSCTYQMMKGLKNFFDHPENVKNKEQYELAGGDLMKRWVDLTLKHERGATEKKGEKEVTDTRDNVSIASLRPEKISTNMSINESNDDKLNEYVICILFNDNNEILMLKRSNDDNWMPGKWAFLGGTMENNESPISAAKREIKEETGISISKLIEKFSIKRENQHEYIFMGMIGNDKIILDDENVDYKFVSVDKINDMDTVPNVMDYIRIVLGVNEYVGK